MDWLSQALIMLGGQLRPHIGSIATILVSTLLVVYGNDINKAVKRLLGQRHIVWRYLIFILLCSFGYGLFLLMLAPFLAGQLRQLASYWLAPCVLAMFIVLGILAERKNQI